ncbi:MAG: Do family serine endopeptidase, partial [Pseudomonadota bacterium]
CGPLMTSTDTRALWPLSALRYVPALFLSLLVAATAIAMTAATAEARGPQSVAPIAAELGDAVVNISTAQRVKGGTRRKLPKVPKGSPFEDLFEDFFDKDKGGNSRRKVSSLGSGFVIDGKEGLIVTNNHVIDGADEITIIFRNGSKLKVDKVLGIDKKTDLALLKVSPKEPLPEVKFGSSESILVGDWVLAIGNPFGLGGSVSVGIISAKERDIRTGPYDDFLQTDAAINKGNSGGPLFNMDGEVIGVNTAIISPSGGSIGIGFAVPSDVARVVLDQLRRFGETRRGWLGVNIQSVTDDLAQSLGVSAGRGALVSTVTRKGPAESGGIEPGDVILRFDGKVVRSMRVLPRLVAQTEEGARVPVELMRKGKRLTRTIEIGRLKEKRATKRLASNATPKPDTQERATPRQQDNATDGDAADTGPVLGMEVSPVTPELVRQYRHKSGVKGLVVTTISQDGTATKKGIEVGDVIAEISGTQLSSRASFATAVQSAKTAKRRSVLLRVIKPDGRFRFVALPVR